MADKADKLAEALRREKEAAWSSRNADALGMIGNVNQFLPVTGDIQSGVQAAQDVKNKKYASALMNSVGLLPFVPAIGGMFIGKGSKVWNPANEQMFLQLEKEGMKPADIWAKTGTLRGADKMLRQETSDLGSKITDNVFEGIKANQRYEGPMGEAFTNPELYKAYPEAGNVTSGMYAWHKPEGSYHAESNTITVGGPGTTSQKNSAIHELQHWVQNKEGFARGANPENETDLIHQGMLRNILEKNPGISYTDAVGMLPTRDAIQNLAMKNYNRSAGEVEAELARTRMNMTPEERLANYPYKNINMKKMIIRERE